MVQRKKICVPYCADFDRVSVTASSGRQRWWKQTPSRFPLLWTLFTTVHSSAIFNQMLILMWCILKNHRDTFPPFIPLTTEGWHSRRLTVMRCVREFVFLCVSTDALWWKKGFSYLQSKISDLFQSRSRDKKQTQMHWTCADAANNVRKMQSQHYHRWHFRRDTAVKILPY